MMVRHTNRILDMDLGACVLSYWPGAYVPLNPIPPVEVFQIFHYTNATMFILQCLWSPQPCILLAAWQGLGVGPDPLAHTWGFGSEWDWIMVQRDGHYRQREISIFRLAWVSLCWSVSLSRVPLFSGLPLSYQCLDWVNINRTLSLSPISLFFSKNYNII